MRKPILFSVAVLLALLPLSSCGKEDDTTKPDDTVETPDTDAAEEAVEDATKDE
jgi:hypothetical protein